MRIYLTSIALALALLLSGVLFGIVVSGHEEDVAVVTGTIISYDTAHYTCWRTSFVQICEPLPLDLPRNTPSDFFSPLDTE